MLAEPHSRVDLSAATPRRRGQERPADASRPAKRVAALRWARRRLKRRRGEALRRGEDGNS